ncbi:MAG: bifunctional (p)ppGpp synthetase/guanosine-3',5'-bis(diphosphate) 3'-pyrophosphohydrolase [Salinivirgaceae bacterium]|nr:bifunctional (p)ppGpp synthetase/guanosine-3',5'-bis(diphosphate) 3'-pyrophosphohydrolase [Salinivirgaceae bacterium]
MENLEQQLIELISRQNADAGATVRRACDFARERLSGVVRETGEPAYTHALRVALIVAEEISLSNVSIVAALLHETLTADNDVSRRIEHDFGPQVLFIINEMLKISHLQKEKLQLNSENYISLVLTITKDVRVVLLKLADTLDKIRQIKLYGAERQLKIAQTARALYAPIAHRLGLYHIKTELEDISLKIIEPEMYYGIARKLNETKDRREQYISRFKQSVGDTLNSTLAGHGYSYEIKGRPKSVNSIYGKIKKQGVDISEIYDLFAIRIILDNVPAEKEKEACWNVYSIITNIYQPNPTRLRDWISTPRASGYESLHTTVMGPDGHWVEVQIRTRRMDDVAEKGNAAHWKYKESGKDESHDQWLSNIRGILESKDGSFDSELDGSGLQLKTANIFAFTPQGDIIKLRQGATILDFAYSIHSNLGNTCTGARVNGKIVPIKYQLSNGDTVEVLTSKNQRPNLEWLNIAVSPRIKARIRRSINEEVFRHAEMGKEMLERKVSQLKIELNDQTILQMITHFKYKHALDFYQDIADEKVDLHAVRDYLQTLVSGTAEHPVEQPVSNTEYTAPVESDDSLIIDRDLVNIDYKLAQCCHPIQGDKIFGFVTVDRGIQIHRMGCPNAKDLLTRYPYRIVKARWNDTERQSVFNADIIITGIDKLGVVNHITEVIAKSETSSLRSLKVNSKDGIFKAYISVLVGSTDQLDALLLNIGKIKDVVRAERAER